MSKKGMSKQRQRRLTLVGISGVLIVWLAALALLFAQPGVPSSDAVLPTLASPLEAVEVLPDTGAAVNTISPTLSPTSLPVEAPPAREPETALVSAPSEPVPSISQNLFTNPVTLDIPSDPVPNSLVLRFEPEMTAEERLAYIESLGGEIVQEIDALNTVIINLPEGGAASIQSIAAAGVVSEPDYYVGALFAPNDVLAAGQWGLNAVRAPEAWDLLPTPTEGVTVAVVDSGVCAAHPDLQGRIVPGGWDFVQNDNAPEDEYGHGCAVAGVIAANSNNGLGIAGVAPNANVMALRVLDASGIGRYSDVAAAIVHAVDNGAEAINLSLGGPNPSSVLQEAVNYAAAHGVTVIAAAGNAGSEQVYYPAAYPSVVAVGSVDQSLQRSSFSNYGPDVDLYAPGSGIMTTRLDGSYQTASGTSVAAPYVTGVWALRKAMGKSLVVNGGIVSAIYENEIPVPEDEPPAELCLLSNLQGAEQAYFGLVSQNAAEPGSVTSEQLAAARDLYLTLGGQCANLLYNDNMTIDGGGISPFGGDIEPLFQVFGTKWGAESPFNVGQPPAAPAGTISYSFMPNNVSLAAKEAENGGGPSAFITAISDLPGNSPTCDLTERIRQAFEAWEAVANIDFVEVQESGIVPFGEAGQVGDMRIGAQYIDGMRGELGHAYFPPPDPEIPTSTRAGDIFLDRSEIWGCAPGEIIHPDGTRVRVIDIGLVMLHELGHALGMQHERAPNIVALMNPTYNASLIMDSTGGFLPLTNAIRSDDQAGVRAIYGAVGIGTPALSPVTDPNDNTPTLSWTDTTVGGSDSFQIQIYVDNNGEPGELVFEGTSGSSPASAVNSFTVPNTLPSQPYLWRVRAFEVDSNGVGAWGDWSAFQPFTITVGIPILREPTPRQSLNTGLVSFRWSLVTGDDTFLLQIDTRPEFTQPMEFADIPGGAFTLSQPLADGTYYWRVRANSSSQFSQISSFQVDAAAQVVNLEPGAPNVSPADGQVFNMNTNISLSWGALPGVTEYQLQLDTSENFVGLLFLDKLFLDKLFLDKLFLDKLFLDKLFLDKLFLDKLFLDKLFLDKLFLDKLFLDKLFLDKLFLDKLFLDKLFLDKLFLDKLFLDKLFLDKLFLDKLFLDKIQAGEGDTVVTQVFDSLPMSEGIHYWRVRARLADGSFGPWSATRRFEVRTQPAKVVINEIKLDHPSWIEFTNTGTQPANMTGWQFFAYGPDGETDLLYTFPTFTLNPGEYVVLYEGEGTNTDKALYTGGSQIEWPLTAQTVNGQLVSQPETLAGLGTIQQPITPVFAAQVDTATSGDLPGADSASAQETPATPAQPETIEPANPAVGETPKLDIPPEIEALRQESEALLQQIEQLRNRPADVVGAQGIDDDDMAEALDVIAVNTTSMAVADDGFCSLVEAIIAANTDTASGGAAGECAAGNGTDIISLPPNVTYNLTSAVDGLNGLPTITSDISMQGGGGTTIARTSGELFRIFTVAPGARLSLAHVNLQGGEVGSSEAGGLILNQGELSVFESVFQNGTAGNGGAIANLEGSVFITRATFIGNSTNSGEAGRGGAIFTHSTSDKAATTHLAHITMSGDSTSSNGGIVANVQDGSGSVSTSLTKATVAPLSGPAIRNDNGVVDIQGSIINGCVGNLFSIGYSIIEDTTNCTGFHATDLTDVDPMLGPLGDYGGVTPTIRLEPGSPAIDSYGYVCINDQRNIPTVGDSCDIGSYESGGIGVNTTEMTVADDGFCSLVEAVDAANSGVASGSTTGECFPGGSGEHYILVIDHLSFLNANNTDNGPSALPTITSDVTIGGSGAINRISEVSMRLAYVNGGDLTLDNITVIGFGGVESGGMIYVDADSSLTIYSAYVEQNLASYGGSVYVNTDGELTADLSQFSGNFAGTAGGAIYLANGATATISRSSFWANEANESGGAIQSEGSLTIVNSTFADNEGGIDAINGTTDISFSTFANTFNLPALVVGIDATVRVKNSIFSANGTTCDIQEGTLIDNGGNLIAPETDLSCPDFTPVTMAALDLQPLDVSIEGTLVHPITTASAAFDAATDCTDNDLNPVTVDQQSNMRGTEGAACDAGAYEVDAEDMQFSPFFVTTTDMSDDGICGTTHCSLVEAINAANADGVDSTIFTNFSTFFLLTENNNTDGANGLPSITSKITIEGDSSFLPAIIVAPTAPDMRIFHVAPEGDLTLNNIILSSGRGIQGGAVYNAGMLTFNNVQSINNEATDEGGAVYNQGTFFSDTGEYTHNRALFDGGAIYNGGQLIVANTTFEANQVGEGEGGAILSAGPLGIYNSTFSDNVALIGSAIMTVGFGEKTISFSTIVNNWGGAAVESFNGIEIRHSIIANNPDGDCSVVDSTAISATGTNFDTDGSCAALDSDFTTVTAGELNLGVLADNGGPSRTHMLGAGSVAIDAAADCLDANGNPVDFDQRFVVRPQRINCDVGAYEAEEGEGTTFTVNNTTDNDDGNCTALDCSLREAINAANALPGTDTIAFNISGPGPHTIQPLSELPAITDPVVINGETEPDFEDKPIIELDGSLAGDVDGLRIEAGNSIVRGLVINQFGTESRGYGIYLTGGGINLIQNNYIGTDVTGTLDRGNNLGGILIENSADNFIGGTTDGPIPVYNVISGNGGDALTDRHGILIINAGSMGNDIVGNFIGMDVTGTQPLGNSGSGVALLSSAAGNVIGNDNVISANTGSGVYIQGAFNAVRGNYIGTDVTGTVEWGNGQDGVRIDSSPQNTIGGPNPSDPNIIAGNSGSGVAVYNDGLRNNIVGNRIFNNNELGIDLVPSGFTSDGVTPNDHQDTDGGPNGLQNFPLITSAETNGSSIHITGTVHTKPSSLMTIQFFSNTTCDISGSGEGEVLLGQVNSIFANGQGDASFDVDLTVSVDAGAFITATVTEISQGTSEFSPCFEATAPSTDTPQAGPTLTVTTTDMDDDGMCGVTHCSLIEAIDAANALAGENMIALGDSSVYTLTSVDNDTDGPNGLPSVTSEITIIGNSSTIQRAPDATEAFRLLHISPEGSLSLNTVMLSNGDADSFNGGAIFNAGTLTLTTSTVTNSRASSGLGGAIFNDGGTLAINYSELGSNQATDGGAIYSIGTARLTSVTVYNNTASNAGGGIFNYGGDLIITNSTIAGNTAELGGGIRDEGGVTLSFVTITGNTGGGVITSMVVYAKNTIISGQVSGLDCYGDVLDHGINFSETFGCTGFDEGTPEQLKLQPLAYNGGPTQTVALGAGSIAKDAVTDCTTFDGDIVPIDQRGFMRPQGSNCDAGAYEVVEVSGSLTVTTTQMIQDSLDGKCSLVEAIIAANTDTPSGSVPGECVPASSLPNTPDVIALGTNQTYTLTEINNDTNGPNGLPVISSNLTLAMNGSTIRRAPDAAEPFRLMAISSDAILNIQGGTLSGGRLTGLQHGAAIFNQGILSIAHLTISDNQTDGGGGAIFNDSTIDYVTINASRLLNNKAAYGGAIYNEGFGITLNDTILRDNEATNGSGGAIYTDRTTGLVSILNGGNNSYINNKAAHSGGAIFNHNTTISNFNATISGNQANTGGAIYSEGEVQVLLSHTTIADNVTLDNDSAAIEINGAPLELVNSIIANNIGGANCSGLATNYGGNIQFPDETCLEYFFNLNPLLGELTQADNAYFYPLLDGSPAIDNGNAEFCGFTDIRGVERPIGAGCDSGSYEGSVAQTGSLTVTTTQMIQDSLDGKCSLVEAIDAANSGLPSGSAPGECVPAGGPDADVITLGNGLTYTLTTVNNSDHGESGLPEITSPITIMGNGSTITRFSGGELFRFFYVDPTGSLTLNNVTLSNGFSGVGGGAILAEGDLTLNNSTIANNEASSGGGLLIGDTSEVTINNSAITGNRTLTNDGGGILVRGTLTIVNSTIAGNSASEYGGGLVTGALSSAQVTITNSTIAKNMATTGAGIYVFEGNLTLRNTIIAQNFNTSNEAENCSGGVSDGSGNLQSDFTCFGDTQPAQDPLLGPLTGNPAYLPLGTGSPAIDAANSAFCPATDQRGIARPQGAGCDIGAVEASEAPALVPGSTGGAAALVAGGVTLDFVRFGDTTLSPLMDSEWRGDNVALPDNPTDANVTIGRDPASGDTNHVTDWLRQRPTEGGQNAIRVLINEVYTGTNDLVELYNPTAETVNLSGWELILYDTNDQIIPAAPGATYTVRFPNGTLLRPGQFLIVAEENPGAGVDFIDIGVAVDWDDWNASGAVSLTNGLTGVDFVRFGGSTVNQLAIDPPPGTDFTGVVQPPLPGESLGRNANAEDTNSPSDWLSQKRSVGQNNPAVEPPAHDEPSGAVTIDSLPFRDTGDTTNASAISDPALTCGVSVGHTVWYQFVATNSTPVRFQTDGSSFDTVLAIFRINAANQLVPVAGACSQRGNTPTGSRLTLNPTANTTYLILLGGNLNASGSYIFSVNAPTNDDVDAATSINLGALPFQTFGFNPQNERVANSSTPNTTAASALTTDPTPTCAPNVGRSVWYRFTASDETTLRLRTAGTGFDTVIAVYTGTRENLVEAACNNDDASNTNSDLAFTPMAGTQYFVQVAGNGDQGGDLFFEVDVFPAPDNDLITDAYAVIPDDDPTRPGQFLVIVDGVEHPAPFSQDTTGAGDLLVADDGDPETDPILDPVALPVAICGLNPGASVWYSYTPTTEDTVVFQTFNSNYDTTLAIWSVPVSDPPVDLSDPANLRFEACNDDAGVIEDEDIDPSDPFQRVNKNARVILSNTAEDADAPIELGRTYYIRVSGYFGETGDLVFNAFIPQTEPPDNDRINTPFDIEFNAEDGSYTVISPAGSDVVPFAQDTTGAFNELFIPDPAPDGWEAEAAFPTPSCGTDIGYTVWYRYAADERQQVVFDAAGSDFDTVIAAYVLQGDNSWVEVGCNDDFEGRPQSKLTLNTNQGITLYVLFGGFKKDRGNLQLGIAEVLPTVESLTLVDAEQGTDVDGFDPIEDEAILDLSELPELFAIRANTVPEETGSVAFKLEQDENGLLTTLLETTDNTAPYALSGNNPDGSYIPTDLLPGTYILTATPYTDVDGEAGQGRAGTALILHFTVVEGDNEPPTVAVDQGSVTADEGLTAINTGTFDDPDDDLSEIELTANIGFVSALPDGTWEWTLQTADGPLDQVVTITATDGDQETGSVAFDLTVNNVAPTAQFSVVFVSQSVRRLTFTNPVDVAADLPGLRYSYDCSFDNDGDDSNDNFDVENVTETTFDCTFPAVGTYEVRGRIADKDGGFTDYTASVVIQQDNAPPTVNAGADQIITLPTNSVDLTGTASDDGLPTPPTLTVTWTAINNPPAPVVFSDAHALETTATFSVGGVYTLQLTVSDGELEGTDTLTVVVNQAPVVDAGADQIITLPTNSVDLTGMVTDDGLPPPPNLTVTWTAINNPPAPVVFGDANALETTATFSASGVYTLQLAVSDGAATVTDTLTVTVNEPANQAPIANAGADQTVTATRPTFTATVTLDGSGSTDSDGNIVRYVWMEGSTVLADVTTPQTSVTLAVGVHTITLTVTDDDGAIGTETGDNLGTVVITVNPPDNTPPVANAGPDQTVIDANNNGSEAVTLDGSGSSDVDGNNTIVSYTWTEGDTTIASGVNPTVILAVGTHTITLTVTDDLGATGSDTVIITVSPPSSQTTTITQSIDRSSDDVNEDGDTFDSRNSQLWVGTGQSVSRSFLGLRFNSLDIPQGAVITEAHVEFYTPTSQWIQMRVLVGADATDNSVTFSSNSRPSGRTFTTARIEHRSDDPWMAGSWHNLGDIKTVIQEIVNRPGWQPGNSLSIIMKGLGSQWGRKFVTSYDGNPAFAPRLVVTYSGIPPANNPPDVTVDPAYANVVVNEGQAATALGTVSDPENQPVTLTASLGMVQRNGNSWTWSYTPPDNLPAPQTVTIAATDSLGASDMATFNLTVNNVAPTASFTAQPAVTLPNVPVTLRFSNVVDVPADLPGLIYSVDCGNGSGTQSGPTAQFSCTYAAEGSYTALGRVTDKDGGFTDYQTVISVGMTPNSVTVQVNSSSDDVNEDGQNYAATNPQVWVGTGASTNSFLGLRFNNVGIPVGATITEAYLEFYTTSAQWITIEVLIAADAADNSPTFSSRNRPSVRTFTTSRVEHESNQLWSANNWNRLTSNLSSVVQEVVNRGGWQPGNSLTIILKGNGNPFGRKFVTSFEGNPAFAPRLVVNYNMPDAPLTAPDEPAEPIDLTVPVPPSAGFSSDVTGGVAPVTVQFSNLSSGDIVGYAWDFGDGSGSTDFSPSHTYMTAGTYTVTLTVTGADGTTSVAQAVIVVTEPPPQPPPLEIELPPEPPPEATAPPEEIAPPPTEVPELTEQALPEETAEP